MKATKLASLMMLLCAGIDAQALTLTKPQLAAIDRYVTAELQRQRIPGVEVAVYTDGHAVFEKGYGLANVELKVPVSPSTMMQSGSIGKQFTASAIMMLVERGTISLDDSISKYFPQAPVSWRPIRVKNLLSHTSGLAEYASGELTKPGGEFDMRLDFSEGELVSKIEHLPIEFPPGDKWRYRNTNYLLLGALIRRVTGHFYGDYLHEKIFAPLGMDATRIISERDIIANRAAGYEIEGGILYNQNFVSPAFNTTADGALYFNVIDLEKWDRALYGTTLLRPESLRLMWTPFQLNDGKPNEDGYGFGWFVGDVNGHRVIEHGGAWQGFTCKISRYVDDRLTVVVLTNLDSDHSRPGNIARVVAGIVEPALMPHPKTAITDSEPRITATLRELLKKSLAGEDVSSYYATDAEYVADPRGSAELQASLGSSRSDLPLILIDRQVKDGLTTSIFRSGDNGTTRRLTLSTNASGKIHLFSVEPDPDNR